MPRPAAGFLLLLLVLLLVPASAPAGEDTSEGWFTDVAAAVGLGEAEGKRTKWVDVDGDGWVDVLVMSPDGRPWMREVLRASGLADGLPSDGTWRLIARSRWPGDDAVFTELDTNGDDVLTEPELREEARRHLWRLYRARPPASSSGLPTYVDATEGSGLSGLPLHLLVAGDLDGDGDVDLYGSGYATQDPGNRVEMPATILRGDGRGRFASVEADFPPGTVCAACFLDYDRDGRLDLYEGVWYRDFGNGLDAFPDRLYRGLGDGRFEDVTERSGLLLEASPGDVLTDAERASGRIPSEKRALVGRRSHRPTYGVAAADVDGDGHTDLFALAYGRQWNLHWKNRGDGTFVEVGERSGFDGDEIRHGRYPEGSRRRDELPFRSNGNSFDVAFADYDNDGDLDAVVSEYTHAWAGESSDVTDVLTNLGPETPGTFRRKRGALERIHTIPNWNQGDYCVAWLDFENDGWLDLLVASHAYPDRQVLEAYRQVPGTGRFERVTEPIGLDWPDAAQLSLADFDRDGDVDVLAGNHPHPSREPDLRRRVAVFRNDAANRSGHHYLTLELEGRGAAAGGSNRQGIGARVTVTAGDLVQTREVFGGHGHVGHQDDPRLVFGLGPHERIDRIEIRWLGPAGTVDIHEDVPADVHVRAREGAPELDR